jgi:YHS domain-containing protein
MVRAVLYVFLVIIAITLLRSIIGVVGKAVGALLDPDPNARAGNAEPKKAGELKRDPVCGTYVSTATSVKKTIEGRVVHFCSPECSARYKG